MIKAQIQILYVALLCLLTVSCMTTSTSYWSVNKPRDELDVWNLPITITTLSNATPNIVLSIIASNVLSKTGKSIQFSFGPLPEPFQNPLQDQHAGNTSRFLSNAISDVMVRDWIKMIADVTDCRALFHKRKVVFAPVIHGDGFVSIELSGRCADKLTGERIPCFVISNRVDCISDKPFEQVKTNRKGTYSVSLLVPGYFESPYAKPSPNYRESHPTEKELLVDVLAPGYAPKAFTVKLDHNNLVYTNDFLLTKQGAKQLAD